MQHAGDLIVAQTVRRFDINLRLHTADLLARGHLQQAVGIDGKGDADARRASHHGRDTAQFKAGQAAAVGHQITLALHHMQRQCGLPVLVGGEVLRHGRWNRLVARHDALDQTAHGLYTQGQGNHIEQ